MFLTREKDDYWEELSEYTSRKKDKDQELPPFSLKLVHVTGTMTTQTVSPLFEVILKALRD